MDRIYKPMSFKEWYRKLHEIRDRYGHEYINYFKDRTWTIAWRFKNYKGEDLGLHYIKETWNGGVMIWDKRPTNLYRFETKEKAQEFANMCLWDKKDPNNKTYKIVQY